MPTRGFGDNQPEENPGNWIAVSRDVEHHPIVGFGQPMKPANPKRGAYSKNEAWQFLLFQAEWKRKRVTNKGRVIWLERGELMGGLSWLAEQWNWSKEAVRWFLKQLEQDMMIVRHNNNSDNRLHARSTGIISVCKYNKYQLSQDLEHLLADTRSNTSATPQQHLNNTTTNKETREQDNYTETRERDPVPQPIPDDLSDRLCDAAGAAIANPAVCPGLLVLSDPIRWLESGCNLKQDILPAVKARAAKAKPQSIRSWAYFEQVVFEARDRRLAPAPDPVARAGPASNDWRDEARARTERAWAALEDDGDE